MDRFREELLRRVLGAAGPLGGGTVRRLGRLRGVFHPAAGDAPFAVLARGDVFFKTGPDTVTQYIAASMRPLRTVGRGNPLPGYWRVPPHVLDDPALLALWATRAVDAARQFGGRRPPKLKRPRRTPGVTGDGRGGAADVATRSTSSPPTDSPPTNLPPGASAPQS